MAKAKRGQTVRFNSSGKVGVIQSVSRGIVRVIFRDGSHGYGHASQFSKASGKGCLVWGFVFLTIPAALIAAAMEAWS